MPKNGSKTGKSSKTARVLSLLTDPLLGGSRNHKDGEDEVTELLGGSSSQSPAHGLDDEATENRIQASLAAEEDSLVTELFGQNPAQRRAQPSEPAPQAQAADETSYLITPEDKQPSDSPEPDPRTLELLSMLSNPTTLGNASMPSNEEPRSPALDIDFSDLTEGMAQQPVYNPEPEPEPESVRQAPPPVQQAPQQSMRRTTPPVQQAPQQSVRQTTPFAQQPATQSVRQAPPAQQPVAQTPPSPRTSSPAADALKEKQDEFICFNLTQALVEDKADKLMRQFGMCTCNRCKVDVTAIALSNLPAKYVATQNREILPLLSMYEEKYSAAVTVQVMSACRMVMSRPHHGR